MPLLGVNIDHIATVRQARKGEQPDPVAAAKLAESAGADSIVAHLREDRRHIQDRDVFILARTVSSRFNLEMSIAPEIVDIACAVKPSQATLVPERRQELTTEGGLDVSGHFHSVRRAVKALTGRAVEVSLFIDPDMAQVDAALKSGATIVEFHTGVYAQAASRRAKTAALAALRKCAAHASSHGLRVCAGHGLDYTNSREIARIPRMHELNIGYSIISRALFVGLGAAIREMKGLVK